MNEEKIERFTPWGTPIKELDEELQAMFDDTKSTDEEANEEEPQTDEEASKTQTEASSSGTQVETEGPKPSSYVDPADFHNLEDVYCSACVVKSSVVRAGKNVRLCFENIDGELDLLMNELCITPVVTVRRMGNALHVKTSENVWHVFMLKNPSDEWKLLMKDNTRLEIT